MPGWGKHEYADKTRNDLAGNAGTVIQAGRIEGDVHVHSIASEAHRPRQLPSTTPSFTGRDEQLAALHAGLRAQESQDGSTPIVLLCGTAGAGKTALAVQWGHQVRDRFPDGQLHANLQGFGPAVPVEPVEILGRFLRALGVPSGDVPGSLDERAALYRTALSDRRVLVILDNAGSEWQIRPLIPGSSGCHVIVTSRQVLSGLVSMEDAKPLQIDALSKASGTALLRTLVGSRVDDEPDAADDLVRFCCGLPLALRIMGQLASTRPATPLAELAAQLADERNQLDLLEAEDDPATDVRAVFSWSYEKLTDEAARTFRMCAVFPGRELDKYAAGALLDTSPRHANRLLHVLVRAHLLTQPSPGRFDTHDLLRLYALEQAHNHEATPDRNAALCRLFEYYLHTAERADKLITPGRYRIPLAGEARESPALQDHESALAWFDSELDNISALLATKHIAHAPDLWQMAYTLRGYFFISKRWKEWIHTHELALAATRKASDQHAEAHTRNNLGLALLEHGLLEDASEHYEVARELFRSVGDEHGVTNAMANLATVLHFRGEFEAALRENEQVLTRYEDAENDRNVAITLRSAALVEIDLGRFDVAIERFRRALSIFQDRELHVDAAMALNGLGEAHLPAGDQDQARRAHERALVLAKECGSGFEHARALHGLGSVALSEEDRASAQRFWEDALGRYRRLDAPQAHQLDLDLETLQAESETAVMKTSGHPDADSSEDDGNSVTADRQNRHNADLGTTMAAPSDGDNSALVVFISYVYESEEHQAAVRQLADLLLAEGFAPRLDDYVLVDRVNLQNWMQEEIENADYTLVIVSPRYERAAVGDVAWDRNRGLRAEAELLQSQLNYDRTTWFPKILPVLLPGHDVDEIPLFLARSVGTHYKVGSFTTEGAEPLLSVLHGLPTLVPPERGSPKHSKQRLIELKKSRAQRGRKALPSPLSESTTKPAERPHPLIAAHSPNERGDWHSLGDHSRSTAGLAQGFAEHWGVGPLAEALGLFHDAGKASSTWQRRLREVQGARRSVGEHEKLGTRMVKDVAHLGAMAVRGHHSGLNGVNELRQVLRASAPEGEAEAKERFLAEVPEAQAVLEGGSLIPQSWIEDPLLYEMGLRMTFSALVDADRLDTIAHKNGTQPIGESAADMNLLVERFEDRRTAMLKELPPRPMDAVRQDVYDSVLAKATLPPGIYRLPAPTGAGKTLAQGGFALHHAKEWGKRRIVVTMPLITVTEQNAQIYRRLLDQDGEPVVLEHHSQVHIDESNERERAEWVKAASENWDAPFVVTTTVQLFESMFGRHPSQVRKLHRLANSVLVLDEVQSLPPRLLLPILDSLRLLVQHFGTTVLLTSATQPEFQSLSVWREIQLEPTSLIDDVAGLFERARRVKYEWRLDPRPTFAEVAEELVEQEQALVMVNSTKDSRRLYRLLKERRDDVWHLSSRMYPRHRSRVLDEVNRRLQDGQPVILVATQLVEAGVDISFPLLWRAIAPADSLQQSAGRAGRHGESTARVVIFDPPDGHAPPEYKTRIAVTRSHFGPGKADPDDPAALREYYLELYRKLGLEGSTTRNARHLNAGRTIQENRKRLEYRDVVDGPSRDAGFEGGRRDRDKAFRMINQNSVPVVIHDGSPEQQAHLTSLTGDKSDAAAAVRALQGWMVQLPIWTVDKLRDGHLEHVVGDLNIWRGPYDEGVGIDEEPLVAESTG